MKRKFGMRLGSLLLIMLLIVGIFPMAAFADGSEEIAAPVAESTLAAEPAADSSSAVPAASGGEAPASAPVSSAGEAPASAPASSGGEAPAPAPASSGAEAPAAAPAASGEAAEMTAVKAAAPAESASEPAAPAESASEPAAPAESASESGQPAETASVDDKTAAPASGESAEAKPEADASKDAPAETASLAAPAAVTDTVRPAMKTASFMLAAPAAANTTGSNVSLTLEITNIINSLHKENGHLDPYDEDLPLSPTQSKAIEHNGTYSFVGGKNYNTSDFGVNYRFQNQFVLSDGSDEPVLLEEGQTIPDNQRITRIANNGNGSVTITHADGSKETKEADNNTIRISPVYVHVPAWRLEYNYIDNVSTGSGSWSNLDAIVSYTHTFSDPSVKTPVQDYEFVEWRNDASGEAYKAGDQYTYPGTELNPGQVKEETVHAWWQPAVSLDYYINGEHDEDHSQTDFSGDLDIYGYTPEAIDGARFEGWYSEASFAAESRYDNDAVAALPEITTMPNMENKVVSYARYVIDLLTSKIWDDGNNADNIRPDSVSVDLYAGEGDSRQKVGESVTLSSTNNWSWLFKNLTAFDALGNKIIYSVEETALPNGYTSAVERTDKGFSITNSHTPAPTPAPTPDPEPTPEPGPEPDPNPNPGPAPNPNPGPVPAVKPDPVAKADPETEADPELVQPVEILPDPVPLVAPVDIIDDPVPQAAPGRNWALINLLCAIGAAITALCMGFTALKKDDPSAESGETAESEERASTLKKSKLLGILPAAASIITFILTEDMRLPMVMTDRWTLLMAVFFIAGLALAWLTRHRHPEEGSTPPDSVIANQ